MLKLGTIVHNRITDMVSVESVEDMITVVRIKTVNAIRAMRIHTRSMRHRAAEELHLCHMILLPSAVFWICGTISHNVGVKRVVAMAITQEEPEYAGLIHHIPSIALEKSLFVVMSQMCLLWWKIICLLEFHMLILWCIQVTI